MSNLEKYKLALDLEEKEEFDESIKIAESLIAEGSLSKRVLYLFLRRLHFKLANKDGSRPKNNQSSYRQEEPSTPVNNKYLNSKSLIDYLAINPDLFDLVDEKDTFKEVKSKLQFHYINHGRSENRTTSLESFAVSIGNERGQKELDYLKKSKYSLYEREMKEYIRCVRPILIPYNTNKPLTSIILVLYNKAPLTFACLKSLSLCLDCSLELIIVDNNSTDETEELLALLKGNVQVVKNSSNNHFLAACNQGLKLTHGQFIALVNNDTIMDPLIFSYALSTYEANKESLPIVGGMIQHLDGKLQEAGSIIFEDGSTYGVGRRDNSTSYKYNYQRSVHFVSGCFLFTHKNILKDLNGFESYLKPAYYEETDLCVRHLKNKGIVLYEPKCKLMHFEFGSNDENDEDNAKALMNRNQHKFKNRHGEWISKNSFKLKNRTSDTFLLHLNLEPSKKNFF